MCALPFCFPYAVVVLWVRVVEVEREGISGDFESRE